MNGRLKSLARNVEICCLMLSGDKHRVGFGYVKG